MFADATRRARGARCLCVLIALAALGVAGAVQPAGASSVTQTTTFTHDPSTGFVTQTVVEPNDSAHSTQTGYTYDAYGNKTAVTVSGQGIATRTTTATYDTKGQFPATTGNALSQSESWNYDPRFGAPTSHTDPNNVTATSSYDSFGRIAQEVRPDGTKTVYTYINCAVSGGCVSGAATAQKAVVYAPDGSTVIGPAATVYYDSLSRQIAVTTQGFDGSTVLTTIQYDANGRVSQTSRPYFQSGGAPHWTVNTYDTIGRVTQVALPNGGSVSYAYHGLTSSVTNDHGQTSTTVRNAQGLAAAITDAAGHTTNYGYDALGDLTSVTDPYGNVIANTYDVHGNKTASSDPDMGNWSYVYDVLGELTSQTDAKGQTTAIGYDVLGRPTSRSENGLVSAWTYDTAAHGIGKLAEAKACTSSGCPTVVSDRTLAYDGLGRPTASTLSVGGTNYTYTVNYDFYGRPSTVAYPSGFTAQYVYTSLSYLSQIKDAGSGTPYWTANARDAEMHTVSQTFGNGVGQSGTYDANTGLLTNLRATKTANGDVASFDFQYDTLGNLNYRHDDVGAGVSEFACYDNLNRLSQYAAGTGSTVTACTSATNNKVVTYDALGNITAKTGVGAYGYNASGSSLPHAVAGIVGNVNGVINPAYSYDANGNMITGGGRTVTYTAFNMAASITQGTTTVSLTYDSEHARIQMTAPSGTTTYLNDPVSGAMEEKLVAGSTATWHDYIQADGHIVAEKFSGATTAVRYIVADHLGSTAIVTDETGAVVERDAYDAWGKRRNLDGSDDTTCSLTSQTTRGFTGHEHIDSECLINANARVYDPTIARFMSADSMVPNPFNGQAFNRFSYVNNGPLSATDPTGHVEDTNDWNSYPSRRRYVRRRR